MYERILIVVEDDATTEPALLEGLAIARCHGAEVVLYAPMPPQAAPATDLPPMGMLPYEEFDQHVRLDTQRRLATAQAAADRAGVRHRQLIGTATDTAQTIADTAASLRCDLVVVGTSTHNAVMRLLTGSLVPSLISRCQVPVVVCRSPSAGARLLHRGGDDGVARRRRRAGVAGAHGLHA